jgi:uncharacterized protein with GYD domain
LNALERRGIGFTTGSACKGKGRGVYVQFKSFWTADARPVSGDIQKNFHRPIPERISLNEEVPMPLFLSQVAYNEEGWQALVSNPQNRLEAIRPVVDKLGGRIINAYFAFGDYDFILISEFPNNVTAAALAIAAAAGGAVKSIKTTPLMDAAEGLEAVRKAASSGYRAPSGARPASA